MTKATKASTADLVHGIRQSKKPGDVVHVGRKAYSVYEVQADRVTLISMCERKLFLTLWG
jgi:thymidine phosphorylase